MSPLSLGPPRERVYRYPAFGRCGAGVRERLGGGRRVSESRSACFVAEPSALLRMAERFNRGELREAAGGEPVMVMMMRNIDALRW